LDSLTPPRHPDETFYNHSFLGRINMSNIVWIRYHFSLDSSRPARFPIEYFFG
jgi:hypothetical protein